MRPVQSPVIGGWENRAGSARALCDPVWNQAAALLQAIFETGVGVKNWPKIDIENVVAIAKLLDIL